MSEVKTRYDEDFAVWSKEQAEALRSAARQGSKQTLDWDSVHDGRTRVEFMLESSPSLRGEVGEAVAQQMGRGARKAIRELRERGELDAALTAASGPPPTHPGKSSTRTGFRFPARLIRNTHDDIGGDISLSRPYI